jgi:hypothetical protein
VLDGKINDISCITINGRKKINLSLVLLGKHLDGLDLARSIPDTKMKIANALSQVIYLILYIKKLMIFNFMV